MGPARQWAYDHCDRENELTETLPDGTVAAYSASLARYIPLCRPCHAEMDGSFARNRRLDVDRIVELYESGIGLRAVARMVGSTESSIVRALRDAGVTIRSRVENGQLQRQRAVCRRGHRLVAPNLVKHALPKHWCLACCRARDAASTARKRRGEVWPAERRAAVADANYAKIMGVAVAT